MASNLMHLKKGKNSLYNNSVNISNLCTGEFCISSRLPLTLDIIKVANILNEEYVIKIQNNWIVIFEYQKGITVHLSQSARMIISGVMDKIEAQRIYSDIMSSINIRK